MTGAEMELSGIIRMSTHFIQDSILSGNGCHLIRSLDKLITCVQGDVQKKVVTFLVQHNNLLQVFWSLRD